MASLILGVGYLGAALAARLCDSGQKVVGLENGFATSFEVLEECSRKWGEAFTLLRGDIRNAADVESAFAAAEPEKPEDALRATIDAIEPDRLAPREALDLLYELKRIAAERDG